MATDHKKLASAILALAVIHAVLSAVVAYFIYSNEDHTNRSLLLGFCAVSVVVNIIILSLAAACRKDA